MNDFLYQHDPGPQLHCLENPFDSKELFKERFDSQRAWLEKSFYKNRPVRDVMEARVEMIDNLIKSLFQHLAQDLDFRSSGYEDSLAVLAVGGYGRQELYPFSDLDLLFLCSAAKPHPVMRTLIEKILYFLWDLGLDIGHSVRNVGETLAIGRRDFSILTALLSARYLTGGITLFEELQRKIEKRLIPKTRKPLLAFLVEDMARRHKEYGSTPYLLEPNIKEGVGGFRDLQVICWLLRIFFGTNDFQSLLSLGIFTENELVNLEKGEEFFSRLRHELHYSNGRKSECLTFDNQLRIARIFGYKDTSEAKTVESFMQQFYFYAGNMKNILIDLVQKLQEKTEFKLRLLSLLGMRRRLNVLELLVSRENIPVENIFLKKPVLAIEAFAIAQKRNLPLDSATRQALKRFIFNLKNDSKTDINLPMPREVYTALGHLFELEGDITATLESMHRLGLLGRLLPEFEAISHLTHHDLYHLYPADTHSIMAVRELYFLRQGLYQRELPLLTELAKEIKEVKILMLAALIHDVGKALPGNHSERGALLASEIGRRMAMPEEEIVRLSFLVKQHLYLNETAQRKDLNDERFIVTVAQCIGDVHLLKMLFLLTFADIKAVGTESWSAWKNMLLTELFFKVLHVLQKGEFSTAIARKVIEERLVEVRNILMSEMSAESLEDYLKSLPPGYLLHNEAGTIVSHIRLARRLGQEPFVYLIEGKSTAGPQYNMFTICTLDSYALFAKISGVMASSDINILEASINTWTNGLALDVFTVNSVLREDHISTERWTKFLANLTEVLTGSMEVGVLISRKRVPTILKEKIVPSYPTVVRFDNIFSEFYTLVEIHGTDRLGLLYAITTALSSKGCYIYKAKIHTRANEVIDTFYVQDIFGQKILEENKLSEIKQALLQAVEPARV